MTPPPPRMIIEESTPIPDMDDRINPADNYLADTFIEWEYHGDGVRNRAVIAIAALEETRPATTEHCREWAFSKLEKDLPAYYAAGMTYRQVAEIFYIDLLCDEVLRCQRRQESEFTL